MLIGFSGKPTSLATLLMIPALMYPLLVLTHLVSDIQLLCVLYKLIGHVNCRFGVNNHYKVVYLTYNYEYTIKHSLHTIIRQPHSYIGKW